MTIHTKTLTTKHPVLNKTIRFAILDYDQITDVYEKGVDIDFGLQDEDTDPFAELMAIEGIDIDILDFTSMYRIFETLATVIVHFERLLPSLLELEDEEFSDVVIDLYRTCISLNPALDPETFKVLRGSEPLGEELERAALLLPELDPAVAAHLGRLQGMTEAENPGMMFSKCGDSGDERTIEDLFSGTTREDGAEKSVAIGSAEERTPVELDVAKIRLLRAALSERVVGQAPAIEAVYSALKRAAVGFRDENRPISVLMFAGPTGVGKTLLSKEAASDLFGGTAFGRIDCAGLSKEYDVSKLLGPAPGYLGYPDVRPPHDPFAAEEWDEEAEIKKKDPSILWKAVRDMDNGGVLVLDEIEKAHPSIQDQFLTIFDEGYITTSVGNRVDFTNILIILTSNLGSRAMDTDKRKNKLGFAPACPTDSKPTTMDADYVKKVAVEAAKKHFKPEIMGRINHIVPFTDLNHEDLLRVVNLEWAKSMVYLSKKIVPEVVLDDSVRGRIATVSKEAGYGARLISRLIEVFVNDPLAEMYIDEESVLSQEGLTVEVKWLDDACDHETIEISCEKATVSRRFEISKTVLTSN